MRHGNMIGSRQRAGLGSCETSSLGRAARGQEGSFRGRRREVRAVRKLGTATAGPTTASGGAMGGGGCCHGESDSVGVLEGGGEQGIGFAWLARLPSSNCRWAPTATSSSPVSFVGRRLNRERKSTVKFHTSIKSFVGRWPVVDILVRPTNAKCCA